jgi:hypothetical protein
MAEDHTIVVVSSSRPMPLQKELETYHERLGELSAKEGKFVLIHGADVVDTFGTYEDAVKEGYQRFKLEPFLVKRKRPSNRRLAFPA